MVDRREALVRTRLSVTALLMLLRRLAIADSTTQKETDGGDRRLGCLEIDAHHDPPNDRVG
jgi:hypothetical protein